LFRIDIAKGLCVADRSGLPKTRHPDEHHYPCLASSS
jgi:hypothetical protein